MKKSVEMFPIQLGGNVSMPAMCHTNLTFSVTIDLDQDFCDNKIIGMGISHTAKKRRAKRKQNIFRNVRILLWQCRIREIYT